MLDRWSLLYDNLSDNLICFINNIFTHHTKKTMSDNNKITTLESVGSGIDNIGMVFPQNTDDTFDLEDPISIFQCTEEFLTSLSKEDKDKIIDVLNDHDSNLAKQFPDYQRTWFFLASGLIQPVECFSQL